MWIFIPVPLYSQGKNSITGQATGKSAIVFVDKIQTEEKRRTLVREKNEHRLNLRHINDGRFQTPKTGFGRFCLFDRWAEYDII